MSETPESAPVNLPNANAYGADQIKVLKGLDAVRKRQVEAFGTEDEMSALSSDDPDPIDEMDLAKLRPLALAAFARLPEDKRQLIMLAYFRDQSRQELSVRLGIPANTVKTHLRRGMAALAVRLRTTSVFARMIGFSSDVVDATEQLLRVADRFEPRAVDLGKVGDRYFTFTSGYGFDASVVAQIDAHPRAKARMGHWYGAYAGVRPMLARNAA